VPLGLRLTAYCKHVLLEIAIIAANPEPVASRQRLK
jgi:hypothetical protein